MNLHPEDANTEEDHVGPACAFVRDNADAFALGALTPTESRLLVDHLADHPDCQSVVDRAIATAGALAFSMPLVAEADLAVKLKLFDRIAAESTPQSASKLQRGNDLVAALAGSSAASHTVASGTTSRSWIHAVSTALVAPMAIALVVVSLWAYSMNDELDDMRNSTAVADPTSSSSTNIEMMTMQTSDDSSSAKGSLGAMPDQKSAVLMAWDLDPMKDHEVWCEESDGETLMVGKLVVSDDGDAMQTIVFPGPIDDYKRIFVSGGGTDSSEPPELVLMMPDKNKVDDDENHSTPES